MFERYTEQSRRTIFFARYEASRSGSPFIESHHLLLALLREAPGVFEPYLKSGQAAGAIRNEVESRFPSRTPVATSVDLPLSHESKRVLAYAAEESERLQQKWIGPVHLVLGLLRESSCAAGQILQRYGMTADVLKATAAASQPDPSGPRAAVGWDPQWVRRILESWKPIPRDRVDGAFRILEALARAKVRVEVTSPEGNFTLSYGFED